MDDQTFAALADTHRREILLALATRGTDAPALDVLTAVSGADSESLRLSLHHTHLPKLADADLVEWDRDVLEVSRGPAFDDVAPVLAVLEEDLEARQVPV